jgi:tRNA A-37 threonylcarbamoyl transferase component Bud32/tetratricopeptide (TPR) repeat protein
LVLADYRRVSYYGSAARQESWVIAQHEHLETALAGRYEIERELGRGGMAIVYLARDVKHGRRVAVKVLHSELANSLGAERFLREINVAAQFNHPNIVALHDSGQGEGLLYYVMPYVEGESLRQRLDRERQLPVDEALTIARQVASALDYAHARGVVHRDIKPENVLLQGDHVFVADFGLARALYTAASPRLTGSGMAVGTPAYMSPEQAAAESQVDSRADVYSLACVIFEMIAGVPPFRGATVQAVVAHHVSTPPPSLCAERVSCPPALDAAVQRALSKVPADRFRTAGALARAIDASMPAVATTRNAVPLTLQKWRSTAATVGAIAAATLIAAYFLQDARPAAATSQIVVLPFAARSAVGGANGDADRVAERVFDALAEWQGVRLVHPQRVRERLDERPRTALRTSEALQVARALGADRLVWGDVSTVGDSITVRATMYDAGRGKDLRRYGITYARANAGSAVQEYRELVSALLRGRTELPWTGPEDKRPALLSAWLEYDAGRRALATWNLSEAEERFRQALAIDSDLAQAHLWLAQVLTWREDEWSRDTDGRSREQRRLAARRAAELADPLRPRDAAVARGLHALADGRQPDACVAFRQALDLVPKDFAAWYGLGDCQSRDSTVLVDRDSPSGYRFRTGLHSAAAAYVRATESIAPPHPSFPYIRLRHILIAEANRARFGRGLGEHDSLRFAAYPLLIADTLAYVPYPVSAFSVGRLGMVSSTRDRALDANRSRLRQILSLWVSTAPQSAAAHEMLADLLETLGSLAEDDEQGSALSEVRRARELIGDSVASVGLARTELRLLLKVQEFVSAKRLADSLLRVPRRSAASEADRLIGAAAITGRLRRTEQLLVATVAAGMDGPVQSDGRPLQVPSGLLKEWAVSMAHASLGACTAPVRDFERRVGRLLESYVADPRQRAAARDALLERPMSLAVPCLGPAAVARVGASRDRLVTMQQMLARNDTAALRAQFDTLRVLRATERPGDISIDHTYLEAWLLAAVGDTAAAVRRLDLVLDAPALLGKLLLADAPHSGGLLRAMALRAELGARTGDRAGAERWGRSVATLWSDADRELQPLVARMREISGAARR